MDTVAQPPADADLHLLTNWSDPSGRKRTEKAAVLSVLVHLIALIALALLPESAFFSSPPPVETAKVDRIITPLIEPLTPLTQKAPTKGKITKEFNATDMTPRPKIQIPQGPPSTTRPKAAIPAPVAPKPAQPVPLPEPPKVETAAKELPKPVLPQATAPPPPQIQAEEKPKSPFESVPGPPQPSQASKRPPSVAEAIHRAETGGGLAVGEDGPAGPGGYGPGLNLAPSPGSKSNPIQLLSDPMGVDFRPYLMQILASVKRNWFAILPTSAKLGLRGKVAIQFSISRDGRVPKLVIAAGSGSEALDRAAVSAISASNPFPPLPGEFKGDRVVLQFNFDYNMPRQ